MHMWLRTPEFRYLVDFILKTEDFGCLVSILNRKLKLMKCKIKDWNKVTFCNIHENVRKVEIFLQEVQDNIASQGHSDEPSYQWSVKFSKFWHQSYFLVDYMFYVYRNNDLSQEKTYLKNKLVTFFFFKGLTYIEDIVSFNAKVVKQRKQYIKTRSLVALPSGSFPIPVQERLGRSKLLFPKRITHTFYQRGGCSQEGISIYLSGIDRLCLWCC